jgi:phosphatidylglycerol---prolipoprotein diacylglyceryl transferase
MYPNIAYCLNDWFDTSLNNPFSKIQTFGLFISICYSVTALLVRSEIKKYYSTFGTTISELNFLIILLFVSSLTGSTIFLLIDLQDLSIAHLSFNFIGSLVGCIITGFLYCRFKKMNFVLVLNCISFPICLGYSIGRLGCHLSGDGDWGTINTMSQPNLWMLPKSYWAYQYPHNVLREGIRINNCSGNYCYELKYPVFPTSLYEFYISLIIAITLFLVKNHHYKGDKIVLSLFLILLGTERFFIEFIKTNPKHNIFLWKLSQAQILSTGMIIFGVLSLMFINLDNKKDTYQ